MGCGDLTVDDGAKLDADILKIKAEYDRYCELRDLQFEFMDEREVVSESIVRVKYANGSELFINGADFAQCTEKMMISPLSVIRRG